MRSAPAGTCCTWPISSPPSRRPGISGPPRRCQAGGANPPGLGLAPRRGRAGALSLTGFGLATALRAAVGDWSWSLFLQESLGLAFACVMLVPLLTRLASRLRATREALAQVEHGDLTVQVADPESDELGSLGGSVNRTTAAIAQSVRQVQQQAQELAAMAQQLAASAQEVQLASQQISATAQQLSRGTARQRQLIEIGRAHV